MATMSTVLITGATTGIGRHLALDLARHGHQVIATGRKLALLEGLAAEAKADGKTIEIIPLDVTDNENIAAAVRAVDALTSGAGLDVLINNAGYGQAGALLEVTEAELRQQFETNVFGLMAVTRAFVPRMVERGRGHVLNVSSAGGRFTAPFFGAYHASKYALEAMSDALRMELAPFGVRVVLIEPGPVHSKFTDRTMASLPQAPGSRYAEVYARADAIRAQSDRAAVGPERVASVVRRAIDSRRPRARYLVPGFRLELMFAAMAVTPTALIDAVFSSVFGLSAQKKALEATVETGDARSV